MKTKKHWHTTLGGALAAAATAVKATGAVPLPWSWVLDLLAAAGLLLLGGTAADKKVVNGSLNGPK